MTDDLITIFKLEDNEELFKEALKPKSVGGSVEFKRMAREGDILLDKALTEIFKEALDTGVLNELMTSIHNRNCLIPLGYHLKIDEYVIKYHNSDNFSDNDIKEAIEALLYASSKVNKSEITNIVKKLLGIVEKYQLYEINYTNQLLELYQANGFDLPEFVLIDAGGPNHQKQWQCKIKDDFFGTNKEYISDIFPIFKEAKQNAAQKFLSEITGISKPAFKKSRPKSSREMKVEGKIIQSLEFSEIVFSKLGGGDFSVPPQLTTNSGETLLEWVERKRKRPFSMLMLLSARIPEISGSAWFASLEFSELALLNIQIEDEHFFEIGIGSSRSQARKDAAEKILKRSKIIAWLYQHKKDEMI
ncbi:MAG TPA: putative dsRNA-binding protein [candidate division Zixibacteria bacterium]|nr:putative dsRNA-binding protein [candidate division Zixibacteria bacterium]